MGRVTRPLLIGLLLVASVLGSPPAASAAHWVPLPSASWQLQFSGTIDLTVRADIFDLDMFDTSRRLVRKVHARGHRAICYINAGAWESWRPDAADFPSTAKGRDLDGWPGEKWLDIRRLDVLGPILLARVRLCRDKGFDGVEFDNVDGYQNATGFELSASDQLAFDRWLADTAHANGLSVGLKNTLGLVEELEPSFDFAIVEQCFVYHECALTSPFVDAGKAVIDIEYRLERAAFCDRAGRLGISAMRKHRELDAWRRPC